MGLQELWFILIAVLFLGFLVLEGFDFGVGMLMVPFGMVGERDPEARRRTVLNTIGPVWDANEVWLITAGASMFAAFPVWYATMFSALYLPLLAILFGMILRIVSIEWRGKIDDTKWRKWGDAGIAIGSWLPAVLWGVAFAILLRGLPIDADGKSHASFGDIINAYTLLGGLATASLFAFYGAVFISLKTAGEVHDDAFLFAKWLSLPAIVFAGGFGLWTQISYGTDWTWLALGVAVVALLVAVGLMWARRREGWAFFSTMVVIASVVVLIFGAMYPNLLPSTLNPDWSVTIYNGSSTPYTLMIMSWAALILLPLVMVYQGWNLLGVPQTHLRRTDTSFDRAVEGLTLNLRWRDSRRCGASWPHRWCAVWSSAAATIGTAVVLADDRRGRDHRSPNLHTQSRSTGPVALCTCLGLWTIRTLAHWLQGRLASTRATQVIADLAGQVLRAVAALPPRRLAAERDTAAALITQGLDGLRPYPHRVSPFAVPCGHPAAPARGSGRW